MRCPQNHWERHSFLMKQLLLVRCCAVDKRCLQATRAMAQAELTLELGNR